MKLALITPAGARSRSGNLHTAMRWAALLRSLALADRLVVLQEMGKTELAPQFRGKTRVIYQSAEARASSRRRSHRLRIAVLGHLREEKDPFGAARSEERRVGKE